MICMKSVRPAVKATNHCVSRIVFKLPTSRNVSENAEEIIQNVGIVARVLANVQQVAKTIQQESTV